MSAFQIKNKLKWSVQSSLLNLTPKISLFNFCRTVFVHPAFAFANIPSLGSALLFVFIKKKIRHVFRMIQLLKYESKGAERSLNLLSCYGAATPPVNLLKIRTDINSDTHKMQTGHLHGIICFLFA